ncbi:jg17767, partial [Pararge aegeria aegeria]
FPQDPEIKEKWVSVVGKKDWLPTKYSKICSCHFTEDDFNMSNKKRRTLIRAAVPTVDIWQLCNMGISGLTWRVIL